MSNSRLSKNSANPRLCTNNRVFAHLNGGNSNTDSRENQVQLSFSKP